MSETYEGGRPAGQQATEGGQPGADLNFDLLLDMIPHMVWVARPDGSPDYWNARLLHYLGRTREEMLGWAWVETLYPEDRQRAADAWIEAVAKGTELYSEYRMRRADGQYRWHMARGTPLRDGAGNVVRWFGTCTDIEERKQAEERLRNSEQKFRALHESLMDAFVSVDMSGRILDFNHAYQSLLGYSEDELHSMTYVDLTPARWHDFEARIVAEQVLTHGYSEVYEKEYRRKDGTLVPIELRTSLVRSTAGEPVLMWAIIRDISERKHFEEALLQSEQRYRAIVESQTEYVSRFRPGGILTYINPALSRWYGAKPEELIGQSFYPFLQEQEREETIRKIESLACEGHPVTMEVSILSRNGDLRWQHWTNHAICDDQGNIVEYQGVGRDITEKKEAELFLARAKEILEQQVGERTESLTLANEQLNLEIEVRKRIEQDLLDYQRRLEAMSLEVSLAADRERARIAGELHDEVGQRLMLSRIKLDALAALCTEPEHEQSLQELQQLVDQTITDIRSLTFQLRPPILASAGLVAAVQWLAEELKLNYGLGIELRHDASPVDFPYETKAAIFQVVRELLLNVAKHADTDRAIVSFKSAANAFNIVVEDYGVGFDVVSILAEHGPPEGFGLFNVQQRIRYLGGRLEFDSMPGKGSRVTIIVPLSLATERGQS